LRSLAVFLGIHNLISKTVIGDYLGNQKILPKLANQTSFGEFILMVQVQHITRLLLLLPFKLRGSQRSRGT